MRGEERREGGRGKREEREFSSLFVSASSEVGPARYLYPAIKYTVLFGDSGEAIYVGVV